MSIKIHETDNLTIIAGKWEYLETSVEDGKSSEENRYTLRLHTSILINGKIKNLFQQYNIKKDQEIFDATWDIVYKLEEYHSFNAYCEILNQLWYDTMWFYWKLDWALEKLFTD